MKLKKLQIRNDIAFLLEFAIDDFKGKYAGSVGGVVWAIIQPISTIILYWFVFQLGFKSQPVIGVPFILWLISGLLPWLFLSDTIANATSSLVDYSYLVKKIKFNIYILPLVKIVSGLFVHFVLLGFVIGMFALYGRSVDIYYLQIPYYLLFTVVILSGVCYLTSTLFVFFRDTIQVVSILLQIIFWTTPIVWSLDIMNTEIQNMLCWTPFYYIVNGYRDIFINKTWFWDYGLINIFYWGIAVSVLIVGLWAFIKCKKHFADVL